MKSKVKRVAGYVSGLWWLDKDDRMCALHNCGLLGSY